MGRHVSIVSKYESIKNVKTVWKLSSIAPILNGLRDDEFNNTKSRLYDAIKILSALKRCDI